MFAKEIQIYFSLCKKYSQTVKLMNILWLMHFIMLILIILQIPPRFLNKIFIIQIIISSFFKYCKVFINWFHNFVILDYFWGISEGIVHSK